MTGRLSEDSVMGACSICGPHPDSGPTWKDQRYGCALRSVNRPSPQSSGSCGLNPLKPSAAVEERELSQPTSYGVGPEQSLWGRNES